VNLVNGHKFAKFSCRQSFPPYGTLLPDPCGSSKETAIIEVNKEVSATAIDL